MSWPLIAILSGEDDAPMPSPDERKCIHIVAGRQCRNQPCFGKRVCCLHLDYWMSQVDTEGIDGSKEAMRLYNEAFSKWQTQQKEGQETEGAP